MCVKKNLNKFEIALNFAKQIEEVPLKYLIK